MEPASVVTAWSAQRYFISRTFVVQFNSFSLSIVLNVARFLFFFRLHGSLVSFSVHSTQWKSFPCFPRCRTHCAHLKIRGRYLKNGKSDNRCRLTFLSVEGELLLNPAEFATRPATSDRSVPRPFQTAFPRIINGYRHYRVAFKDYETRH